MKHIVRDSDGKETIYEGFRSAEFRPNPKSGDLLVVAWFEGSPELYLCENEQGIESLKALYKADWPDHEIEFTVTVVR